MRLRGIQRHTEVVADEKKRAIKADGF